MSKKSMILMIVTLLCIITTVVLRGVVDKADAEYTEVEVRVVSSDTVYRKILGKRQMQYDVFVSYLGQEYELKGSRPPHQLRWSTLASCLLRLLC